MKHLLLLTLTLLFHCFSSKSLAEPGGTCQECKNAPACVMSDGNFQFEYYEASENTNGTTSIKFRVTNFSQFPVEYVAFELPGVNLPAVSPVASYINQFHYVVQNTFNDSLIKFTGLNTSTYRFDQADVFSYQVNSGVFNNGKNSKIKVMIKAGEKLAAFTFDLNKCGAKLMTPLPVELISFKGTISDKEVKLTWITASEKNCDHFAVQHSADGTTFEEIGKVAGNGTVSSQKTYYFTHQLVAAGKNYYRLKQVDLDGKYEYSPIIVLEQKESKNQAFNFAVFPNPVTDGALHISFGKSLAPNETLLFTIFDLNGKAILSQASGNGQELKLDLKINAFKVGMYLLQIKAGRQQSFYKIIIN